MPSRELAAPSLPHATAPGPKAELVSPRVLRLTGAPNAAIYSPIQIQPGTVILQASLALSTWFNRFGFPFQRMKELGVAVTYRSCDVDFLAPVQFFDADGLDIEVTSELGKEGLQARFAVDFFAHLSAQGREKFGSEDRLHFVRTFICLQPLSIQNDDHMAGFASRFPPAHTSVYIPEEKTETVYLSRVPKQVKALELETPLASRQQPFRLYRHHVEHADQWYWVYAYPLICPNRDELCLADETPEQVLRGCLSAKTTRIEVHFTRACFLFDQGTVESSAFRTPSGVTFVHRLVGQNPDEKPFATILEHLAST